MLSEVGDDERRNGESFTEFLLGSVMGFDHDDLSGDDGVTGRSLSKLTKGANRPGSRELCRLGLSDDGILEDCPKILSMEVVRVIP